MRRSPAARPGSAPRGARRDDALPPPGTDWRDEVTSFLEVWTRRRSIGERWQRGIRYTLARIPPLLRQLGGTPPVTCAADVTESHVGALRTQKNWARATTQFYFAALRQFLRWSGNPVADSPEVWRLPAGGPSRRRWIAPEELATLLRRASGPARLIVALEGFNGLRRVEVLRLRAGDVNLDEGWLNVRGKGRLGGKWRQIPLSGIARRELVGRLSGVPADSRVLPFSASWADQQLAKAARAAGFDRRGVRVSHHDLRRTFGRVAHASGMDLIQLKNLFGHANLDMSVHYIGLDLDRMRAGLGQIDRTLGPLVQARGATRAGSSDHPVYTRGTSEGDALPDRVARPSDSRPKPSDTKGRLGGH
ncbi:MAG TPA: site-specific integrase [Thermoplasmata archaeon]|nr:site-specific integrase [Thermoplasmata archaeon]